MIRRVVNAAVRRAQELLPSARPAILMYHRIAQEDFDPWGLAVCPDRFEKQMEWIVDHRRTLPLSEFVRRQRDGCLPNEAIAVTFDDGYASVANVAAPILRRLSITATVFIPSELIRREREFWWDELERIVLHSGVEQLAINGTAIMLGPKQTRDRTWRPDDPPSTMRQKTFLSLWSKLSTLRDGEREARLEELRVKSDIPAEPRQTHRPMTPNEAHALASETVEFGAHSLTHPDLPKLSEVQAAEEIGRSIADCADLIGHRPRAFAYPYGRYNRSSERLAAQTGYECACTAEPGFVRRSSSRFALPRVAVGNWDVDTFQRKLLGGR